MHFFVYTVANVISSSCLVNYRGKSIQVHIFLFKFLVFRVTCIIVWSNVKYANKMSGKLTPTDCDDELTTIGNSG